MNEEILGEMCNCHEQLYVYDTQNINDSDIELLIGHRYETPRRYYKR